MKTLPAMVMQLFANAGASNAEGISALMLTLAISQIDSNISKEDAMKLFSETWDRVEPMIPPEKRMKHEPGNHH